MNGFSFFRWHDDVCIDYFRDEIFVYMKERRCRGKLYRDSVYHEEELNGLETLTAVIASTIHIKERQRERDASGFCRVVLAVLLQRMREDA